CPTRQMTGGVPTGAAGTRRPGLPSRVGARCNERSRGTMSDKTTVSTNVDTFNDGGSYYVRTEIEARLVSIHGPFPGLDTAKRLQAQQTAYVKSAGEGVKHQLEGAAAASPAGKAAG